MKFKLVAVAAALLGCTGAYASAVTIVKIGHVGPVSGAQAAYGKDNENGARMAIDDLNAKGYKIGGKLVKFELVAEDDAADAKQGAAVAQKLCDMRVAGVIGHLNSGTTIPASKIYNHCGIPHITPSSTNPDLTKPGYNTTFRLLASDNALGAGLATYASDRLKLKTVAIIDDRTAYGQGVASVFKKIAEQRGIRVVAQEYTNDKAVDFMSILTSIKAKKPDAIFFGGMDPQAGPMLRQMEQLGMTKTVSIAKMPGGAAWKARYDAKYPNQFQIYSPYVYDATMVLADAMQRAGSADPKIYTAFIGKANFKGVTTTVQFEKNGELLNPAITISTYRNNVKTALN